MVTLIENIASPQDPFVGKYTVMVSSSILDFENELDEICAYLRILGYNVICSKEGTVKADARLGNFENCYKAVEACDLFLGIVRPYTGSGKEKNGKTVTFNEFIHARETHKPSWYIVDKRVNWTSEFCRELEIKEAPKGFGCVFSKIWALNYKIMNARMKKFPRVLDLFRPSKSRRFSTECFEMEKFVNQVGKYKPTDGVIRNNWMQYCYSLKDMKTWIETNFKDRAMIESNVKEA